MSLTFALAAAVNGTTGLRAILLYGLVRTKLRRRRSGQHPGFSRRTGGRASGHGKLLCQGIRLAATSWLRVDGV
jgi:hypothetical protein